MNPFPVAVTVVLLAGLFAWAIHRRSRKPAAVPSHRFTEREPASAHRRFWAGEGEN